MSTNNLQEVAKNVLNGDHTATTEQQQHNSDRVSTATPDSVERNLAEARVAQDKTDCAPF